MAMKLYPLGLQTFSEIRERNMLYIDKTEYVYRIASSGKYFSESTKTIRKVIACIYIQKLLRG